MKIILDLFCGAGGAADGYHRAQPDAAILGIDIFPQPFYPYMFTQGDVLPVLDSDLSDYALIHASPPCQPYSTSVRTADSRYTSNRGRNEPKLIGLLREKLADYPYVIENVMGAKEDMLNPILLCGSMFGLHIPRHRLFETNLPVPQPYHPLCLGMATRYAEENGLDRRDVSVAGKGRNAETSQIWSRLLGVNREMRQSDYAEAIPPAYTEYIGRYI